MICHFNGLAEPVKMLRCIEFWTSYEVKSIRKVVLVIFQAALRKINFSITKKASLKSSGISIANTPNIHISLIKISLRWRIWALQTCKQCLRLPGTQGRSGVKIFYQWRSMPVYKCSTNHWACIALKLKSSIWLTMTHSELYDSSWFTCDSGYNQNTLSMFYKRQLIRDTLAY